MPLERLTFVTIASLEEPGPLKEPTRNVNQSPLAGLSKAGVEETHELRRALKALKSPPVDTVFAAAPLYMLPAVAEMVIVLTGDIGTGYAELPLRCFPLLEHEAIEIHRLLSLNPTTSLMLLMRMPEHADFLTRYAAERNDQVRDGADYESAEHALVLGLSVLVQAIARSFSNSPVVRREIEATIPRPGDALYLNLKTGVMRVPGKQPVR